MKEAVAGSVRKILFRGYYLISLIMIPFVYNRSFRHGELRYLSREDFSAWKSAMLRMLKEYCNAGYNFRIRQVIYTFANSRIEVIRKTEIGSEGVPVVVLCVKNDLKRIQMLVEHYRKLGIQKFAFLDNGSDDGTFEWMMEQPDIDLFRCYEKYQTAVKEGWINRIISFYGFNRWYIATDSDELITYIGMEEHSLKDVVSYAAANKIKRIKGLTLDMYADGKPFGNVADIRKEYRWMDVDTYFEKDTSAGTHGYKCFLGGPRYRLMGSRISLSKYPLVFWEKGTVSDSAHFQYPHTPLASSPCFFGILHFKFIDKDLEEYRRRAEKDSGFSSGGLMYKQYIKYVESTGGASFMYEDSREFLGSESLGYIPLIKKIEF